MPVNPARSYPHPCIVYPLSQDHIGTHTPLPSLSFSFISVHHVLEPWSQPPGSPSTHTPLPASTSWLQEAWPHFRRKDLWKAKTYKEEGAWPDLFHTLSHSPPLETSFFSSIPCFLLVCSLCGIPFIRSFLDKTFVFFYRRLPLITTPTSLQYFRSGTILNTFSSLRFDSPQPLSFGETVTDIHTLPRTTRV